tara:strand:- start:3480 stop:5453 length:1974 start_codon:yes stop_codon:yes gene_type:complete
MKRNINSISELLQKKRFKEAKIKCEEIFEQNMNNFVFLNIFAIVLFQLKEFEDAQKKWKQSIKVNPEYLDAYSNLINAYLNLEKYDEALIYIDNATKIDPKNYELYHKKGNIFLKKNKLEEALKNFEKALEIKFDHVPSLRSKVVVLKKINKLIDALKELDKILLYDDDKVKAYMQRAAIYISLRNPLEAMRNFEKAYSSQPNIPFVYGDIIHEKTKMCDWNNLDKELQVIKKKINDNEKVIAPFVGTTLFDSPELQLKISEIWAYRNKSENSKYNFSKNTNNKIKLGYFSAEFRSHAMGYLMNRIYDLHDKSLFEVYGFYFGPPINSKDKLQKKIINSFDKFIDVNHLSDHEITNLVRDLEIDIGIDLMGYTGGHTNRFTIFQNRVAPIQVSFLGFPCTTGSKCIDYLIADKIVIPKKFQKFYSEKIIYLPDTYQPNEEIKKLSFDHKSKSSVGLPENKFIFCCFNAHQKINLKVFKVWMRILKERENSILWLLKDNELSENNLKREADNLGVDPERLVFAKKLEIDQHLSRLKFADLFLDTYPYGAHTTCSNALRMCLPVITLAGDSFASRVSASLLNSINLNELITNDLKSYEKLALNISNDKKLLNEIKNKIKLYSTKKNLFKPDIFTKNLEKSYKMIYENYLNDHNPKEIEL